MITPVTAYKIKHWDTLVKNTGEIIQAKQFWIGFDSLC